MVPGIAPVITMKKGCNKGGCFIKIIYKGTVPFFRTSELGTGCSLHIVFSLKFCDFSEPLIVLLYCSTCLVCVQCTRTDTKRKQRKARVRNILKSSEKTQKFNEHPVAPTGPIPRCFRSSHRDESPWPLIGELTLFSCVVFINWFLFKICHLFC